MNTFGHTALTTGVLLVGFATFGCAARTSEMLLQSVEEDRRIGQKLAMELEEIVGVYDDTQMISYVEAVGRRVEDQLPDRRFQYHFQILDQPEPNAFAAPGGHIYVSRGLLALINTEDELANVLGHEMTHVFKRHSARQMANEFVPGLLSLPGNVVGYVFHQDVGDLINLPVNTVGAFFLSSYSRQDELEADVWGQRCAAEAGYDPRAMASLLQRMEAQIRLMQGQSPRPSFFDTHPSTPQRVHDISRHAKRISWESHPPVAGSREEVLRQLEGLILGDNPAQGIFRGTQFMHPDLGFCIEFPAGWGQMNTPAMTGAVSPSEDGMVILRLYDISADPEVLAKQFVQHLAEEFEITPSRSEAVHIGNYPGYVVTVSDNTARQPMHMHLLWIARQGIIYQLIGMAPERYGEALRQTAFSFRDLTDEERTSIQVIRLRLVTARQGEDLEQLSIRTENLWTLQMTVNANGISPEETLEQGQRIKIARVEQY